MQAVALPIYFAKYRKFDDGETREKGVRDNFRIKGRGQLNPVPRAGEPRAPARKKGTWLIKFVVRFGWQRIRGQSRMALT